MAKKNDKELSYYELMNKYKPGGLSKNKMLIDISEFDKLKANEKRVIAIQAPIHCNIILGYIISEEVFSNENKDKIKEAEKLMNGINLIQKAKLAYLLGIIDETVKKDLIQIHEIRNEFAHNSEADFNHKDILKCVRKLSTAKGQQVTERNSFKFYKSAAKKCSTLFREKLNEN